MMSEMFRRLGNIVMRGKVLAVDSSSGMQRVQIRLLDGETKDGVENFEQFGFTSRASSGSEHLTIFVDGDRSHGITLLVADRRYRLTGLLEGEAALHNQHGDKVVMHADRSIEVVAANGVNITAPLVTITGDLTVSGTVIGTTDVIGGGKHLKTHTHSGVTVGSGTSGQPS
jgi:phage baseplate assembly protein V